MSLFVESSGRIFGRSQGVVEMRRFYPVDKISIAPFLLINQ